MLIELKGVLRIMGTGKGICKTTVRLVLSVLLVGVFIITLVAPALASFGPNEFYLSNTISPVNTVTSEYPDQAYIMIKKNPADELPPSLADSSISISPGGTQLWLANEQAEVNVTWNNGMWVLQMKTDGTWADALTGKCIVAIGEWDISTNQFNPFEITPTSSFIIPDVDGPGINEVFRLEFQASSETVYKNNYLVLSITNLDSDPHTVYTDGESSLKSPDSDPGYPLPETAAIVLLGIGVVGLLGYVGLKRFKISPNNQN
jgi:hypothetical protein